jgi:3-deoxy-D-arabino-heptulosonate 7-phosphate (DAHP) synthase class II
MGQTRRKVRIAVTLRKGLLTKLGYVNIHDLSEAKRHAALKKAVKAYGSLSTWKKLNILSIFAKNKHKNMKAIYDSDKDWIKDTYGLKQTKN